MKKTPVLTHASLALLAALSALLFIPAGSLAQQGGATPAPDRPGNDDTSCPPGNRNADGSYTKGDPNDPKDEDKNGDSRKDYYMGEYKFVEGQKDLIVRIWCINKPAVGSSFGDFFSLEIITSLSGAETPRIAPTSPT